MLLRRAALDRAGLDRLRPRYDPAGQGNDLIEYAVTYQGRTVAVTDTGHVAVMNREVTIRSGDVSRTMQLADRSALRALLVEHFGFDLPEVEALRVATIDEWR